MNHSLHARNLLAIGLCAVAAVACAPESRTPQTQASPERQADSEYDLARDAFYKGRLREALDHAERANTLDDQNAKALYFTAVIYLGFCSSEGMASPDCRLKTAEELSRKALEVEDRFRDARNMLGQILILEEKYAEAMKTLEPLTKDPAYGANYLAWGNYGWAQVKSGRVDDGIISLRNSVTEPRFCTGDYRLGMAYEQKGDLVAAEKSFSDAVLVPSADCQSLQDAWFERGKVRQKLGNTPDAMGDYARCREISVKTDTGKECAKLAGKAAPTPVQPLPGVPGQPPPGQTSTPSGGATAPQSQVTVGSASTP
jgi:type IV pilus assembly protein PilF